MLAITAVNGRRLERFQHTAVPHFLKEVREDFPAIHSRG